MKFFAETRRIFCMVLFYVLLTHVAYAVEVKGVNIADQVTQPESGKVLVLNGTGMRTKFFFDIYIGALYLAEKSSDAKIIIDSTTPKRVAMHFLREKIEKKKLTDGWNDAFDSTLDKETFSSLKIKIDEFNGFFPDIVKGDTVVVDFIPGKGTAISINEQRKGIIPGDDFQRALLAIWLGDSPPNKALKDGMLGTVKE